MCGVFIVVFWDHWCVILFDQTDIVIELACYFVSRGTCWDLLGVVNIKIFPSQLEWPCGYG